MDSWNRKLYCLKPRVCCARVTKNDDDDADGGYLFEHEPIQDPIYFSPETSTQERLLFRRRHFLCIPVMVGSIHLFT